MTDGYVVTVPDGRAVIGDVELGSGSTVTVRDGVLVTADPATTTSTTPSDVTATDRSGASTTAVPVDPPGDGLYPVTPVPDGDRATDRGTDTAPPVATSSPRLETVQVGELEKELAPVIEKLAVGADDVLVAAGGGLDVEFLIVRVVTDIRRGPRVDQVGHQ